MGREGRGKEKKGGHSHVVGAASSKEAAMSYDLQVKIYTCLQ